MSNFEHVILMAHAPLIREWFKDRGGIQIWNSADLGNPDLSWTGPITNSDGTPATKPTWRAQDKPAKTITDPSRVGVISPVEVKRFRIAVQAGRGFKVELTAASSKKVRAAVDKADKDAWYEFDYDTQEAVIYKPGDAAIALNEVN